MTIKISSSAERIRSAFKRLPRTQRLQLLHVFEQDTWAERLDHVVKRIRRRAKRFPPISDDEIVRICREVRLDRHERLSRRSRR